MRLKQDPRFLELLEHLHRADGEAYRYYWTKWPNGKKSLWHSTHGEHHLPMLAQDVELYFSVHPSATKGSKRQRSTKASICAINTVFAEVDPYKLDGFDCPDEAKAHTLASLTASDTPPNVIVDSGGGYHCYWLLKEPFMVTGAAERERAMLLQYAWVERMGGDDGAKDLARVLRVPGSLNFKYDPPRLVEIVHWELDVLHSMEALEWVAKDEIAQIAQAREEKREIPVVTGATNAADDEIFARARQADRSARITFDDLYHQGNIYRPDKGREDHSAADLDLCKRLVYATDRDLSAVDRLFRGSALMRDKWERDDYRESTLAEANRSVRKTHADYLTTPKVATPQDVLQDVEEFLAGGGEADDRSTPRAKGKGDEIKPIDIGRQFVAAHKDDMILVAGEWYKYDEKSGLWELRKEGRHVAVPVMKLIEQAGMKQTSSEISVAMRWIRGELEAEDDYILDNDIGMIALGNGLYDIEARRLVPYRREHYRTMKGTYDYDPAATAPTWAKFVQTTFVDDEGKHDPEIAALIQEAMGLSFTTIQKFHKAFWVVGEGGNGKSVLFDVMKAMLGTLAGSLDLNTLHTDRYQLASIPGKTFLACSEIAADTVVRDDVVKRLVSGDELRVREIKSKGFEMRSVAKLWFSVNNMPKINDRSTGFWRRFIAIPFNANFSGKGNGLVPDKNLTEKLLRELPGIFNWAMEGLYRLLENDEFTQSAAVERKTAEQRILTDPLCHFVEEMCVIAPEQRIDADTFCQQFQMWADVEGIDIGAYLTPNSGGNKSVNKNRLTRDLGRIMQDAGVSDFKSTPRKDNGVNRRIYVGLDTRIPFTAQ